MSSQSTDTFSEGVIPGMVFYTARNPGKTTTDLITQRWRRNGLFGAHPKIDTTFYEDGSAMASYQVLGGNGSPKTMSLVDIMRAEAFRMYQRTWVAADQSGLHPEVTRRLLLQTCHRQVTHHHLKRTLLYVMTQHYPSITGISFGPDYSSFPG